MAQSIFLHRTWRPPWRPLCSKSSLRLVIGLLLATTLVESVAGDEAVTGSSPLETSAVPAHSGHAESNAAALRGAGHAVSETSGSAHHSHAPGESFAKALMQLSSRLVHSLTNGQTPAEEDMPKVKHYKRRGGGYKSGSPLYKKQQAIERLEMQKTQRQQPPAARSAESVPMGLPPPPGPSDGEAPLSTSLRCIVNLIAQFFLVYTILFVLQALNTMNWFKRERETKAMTTVATTVYFVPMLCVLFLAVRMRALQLSKGQPELYDLPPWWVKSAMVVCSWSVAALTLLVFVCTMLYGDMWEAQARSAAITTTGKVLVFIRNATQTLIYLCFVVICFGLVTMQAPQEVWGSEGEPPVSPAVSCTVFLSTIYFMVYIALALSRASNEAGLQGPPQRFRPTQELLKTATLTVAFVPMLCVLFIAVRLRALQFDPIHGNPPRWVQGSFYLCTAALLIQAVLALFGSSSQDVLTHEGGGYVDSDGGEERTAGAKALMVARMLTMITLNGGVVVAILGVYAVPDGRVGPEVPVVLRCVVHLTALYFLVYLLFCTILSANRLRRASPGRSQDLLVKIGQFLEYRGREAVRFCPIFCILFLATFMRALHITQGAGAPPGWCQDLSRVATWGITILTIARFDMLMTKPPMILAQTCHAIQYVCLTMLYCAAIGMVVSLYTMTPETANGPGSMATAFSVASNSAKHPFHTAMALRPAHPSFWHW